MTSFRYAQFAVSIGLILIAVGCGTVPNYPPLADDGSGGNGGTQDPGTLPGGVIDETYGDYNIVASKSDGADANWDFTVQARRGVSDNLAFAWDFGDGRTYGGVMQSFTFDGPGSYQIRVTAYDQQGRIAFVLTLNLEVLDGNQPPIADAGADLNTTSNQLVFLYGGGSFDPDSTGLEYEWVQLGGPPVSLLDTSFPTARFVAPMVASNARLDFGLTVSDGQLSSQDAVAVTVAPITETVNTGATADAGADQQVGEGTLVTLDGSGSSGAGILTFSWTQISGTVVTLEGGDTETATFVAPAVAGTGEVLTFELTVADGDVVAKDQVAITVTENVIPDPDCNVDSDSDGTMDCDDGCPDDASKVEPGVCGCGRVDTDSDGDGVADCVDRCPGTADVDSDADGVLNCQDGCPDDPDKTMAGICGCGIADTDSDGNGTPDCAEPCPAGTGGDDDGDGTPNCLDDCPNDPRKTTPGVCGCGSPDSDSDRDGVLDCTDQCPGEPDVDSDRDGVLNCDDGCPTDRSKTTPGTCGCGVPDVDSDGDGALNCQDGCTSDANKTEPGDCGCGVADTDTDNNGVTDCLEVLTDLPLDEDFAAYLIGGNPPNWQDTDANNSLAINDALFKVFDLSGNRVLGTSSTATNIHSHYVGTGSQRWSSLTFTGRMRTTSSDSGIGITFLSSYPQADVYYRLRRYSGNGFHIAPHGSTITGGDAESGVIPTPNVWYRFRIEVDVVPTRTDIRANVWLDGISEPSGWQINCYSTGTDRLSEGTIGAWSMGGGNKYWDDFAVELVDCGGDADGDGVADCADQCPGQPDTDSDGDGTPDCTDGCPNDSAKTDAGVCGCGVVDTDSNNNGTADCVEPAKLCVSTNTLSFGSSATTSPMDVWNCGRDSLSYTVWDDMGWLTVSPTSGGSSGERDTLTVTVNRNGLTDGTYQGVIIVTPSVGTAVSIMVSMTVGASAAQPMTTASRTSGVAPLAVFFDAVAASSGVVQPSDGNYASSYYRWNFNDAPGAVWSTNGMSKNSATGSVAAHVFEAPGSYDVQLIVTTQEDQTFVYQQTIEVRAFSGTTYYVRTDGSDANSGRGPSANEAWKTYKKAIGAVSGNSIVKPGDRVLFRRGDVFHYATGSRIRDAHDVIIGAYPIDGDLASRPLFQYTGTAEHDQPAIDIYGNCTNIAFVDLRIDARSTNTGVYGNGFSIASFLTTAVKDILLLRSETRNTYLNYFTDYSAALEGLFLVESTFAESHDYKGHTLLGSARKLVILGSTIDRGSTGAGEWSIGAYLNGLQKAVIASSILSRPNPTSPCVRVAGNGKRVDHVVMIDNTFDGGNGGTTVELIASDPNNFEVRNVLIEGNTLTRAHTLFQIREGNTDITLRNNLFKSCSRAILIEPERLWGSIGPIDGLRIYNNVIDTTGDFPAIDLRTNSHVGLEIFNNIIRTNNTSTGVRLLSAENAQQLNGVHIDFNHYHAANRGSNPVAFAIGGTGYTLSQWLSGNPAGADQHSRYGDPQFVTEPSNSFANSYFLGATSPAIDAGLDPGAAVPEPFDDPTRTPWPGLTGANVFDIGIHERR